MKKQIEYQKDNKSYLFNTLKFKLHFINKNMSSILLCNFNRGTLLIYHVKRTRNKYILVLMKKQITYKEDKNCLLYTLKFKLHFINKNMSSVLLFNFNRGTL